MTVFVINKKMGDSRLVIIHVFTVTIHVFTEIILSFAEIIHSFTVINHGFTVLIQDFKVFSVKVLCIYIVSFFSLTDS